MTNKKEIINLRGISIFLILIHSLMIAEYIKKIKEINPKDMITSHTTII